MTTAATETAVKIKPGDVALVRMGTKYTKNALKNAKRLNSALGLDVSGADMLENQIGAVCDAIDQRSNRAEEQGLEAEKDTTPLILPGHLVPAARIGVSLQYGKIADEQKKLQGEFQIDDTRGVDKRVKQLDRLLRELGGQPELALGNEEDEE